MTIYFCPTTKSPKSPNTIVHGPSKSFDYYISCTNRCTHLPHSGWVGIGFCASYYPQGGVSRISPSASRRDLFNLGHIVVFEHHPLPWLFGLVAWPHPLFFLVGSWVYGGGAKLPNHYPVFWPLFSELVQHQPFVGWVCRWGLSAKVGRPIFGWRNSPYGYQTGLANRKWCHSRTFCRSCLKWVVANWA